MISAAITKRLWQDIEDEYLDNLKLIHSSNQLYNSTYTNQVSEKIKNLTNTSHCVFTTNGTSALTLALIACGIKAGDEVICSNLSYVASANQVSLLGATPVFVDIDKFGHISADQIEEKITDKTKAILPVGLYGDNYESLQIQDIAKKYHLKIIEDSAQSYGTTYSLSPAGSLGHVGILSFARNKPAMTAMGGGALVTNDEHLASIAQCASTNGKSSRYGEIICRGINGQQCEDRALSVNIALDRMPLWNKRRLQIVEYFMDACNNKNLAVRTPRKKSTSNGHKFVYFTEEPQAWVSYFKNNNVECGRYYQEDFENSVLGKKSKIMHNTIEYRSKVVVLPTDPYLTDLEVEKIGNLIKNFNS